MTLIVNPGIKQGCDHSSNVHMMSCKWVPGDFSFISLRLLINQYVQYIFENSTFNFMGLSDNLIYTKPKS